MSVMRCVAMSSLVLVACAGGREAPPGQAAEPLDWAFDVPALLEGARSDVPDEALLAYPAVLGGSLTRHTAITGIEFHIPGVISSVAMSPTPIPLRRELNGVAFWQVTGELSARVVDDLGLYRAFGPIDSQGVNHRAEPFDAYEPTAEQPDDPASHPRAGLPGAFFAIRWPVHGWNGGIIQNQAPADAGHGFPQAPLAWMNVDVVALLDAGYAIVTVGGGATAYARNNPDGSYTIDTNPESGSGIFWTDDRELWPDGGVWVTERNRLVPTERAIAVDADFHESAIDAHLSVELYVPDYNEETGQFGVVIHDDFVANPWYSWPVVFAAPELIRDATVVFKSFLTQATGRAETWACYLGWSGSGVTAFQLAAGKQNNALVFTPRAMGSPPGAGNYNLWRQPGSGRRFDAFVVYAGGLPWPWFTDDTDLDAAIASADVDPEYPIQAPYVFLHGDADMVVSQVNPILETNAVARAWGGSQLASQPLEDHVAILTLEKATHQQRDQILTNFDRPPYDGALWWDPALGDAPEALNTEHRGLRISDEYARMYFLNGPGIQGYARVLEPFPRMTPMYLALFEGLRAGTMPESRVDPDIFEHMQRIKSTTWFPLYDNPCELGWDAPFEVQEACSQTIRDDSTGVSARLTAPELAALREFATANPLARSTERLRLPDVAAPLGYFYFMGGIQLRRDFSKAELKQRYRDHAGYVSAFEAAGQALMADGLWEPGLGELYDQRAAQSGVLLKSPSP